MNKASKSVQQKIVNRFHDLSEVQQKILNRRDDQLSGQLCRQLYEQLDLLFFGQLHVAIRKGLR